MSISEDVANILLEVGAFKLYEDYPFQFEGGTLSPVSLDCRKIISYPSQREKIIQISHTLINEKIGVETLDVIAGGEIAGIPFAYGLATVMNKPMIYVLNKPGRYGTQTRIEGTLNEGERVLLFEELFFREGGELKSIEGISKAGGTLENICVIFEYGVKGKVEALEERGVKLWSLTNWKVFSEIALSKRYLTQEKKEEIELFLEDPRTWAFSRSF